MRVQCDVCEKAEAALVCCADEAALCASCDAEVHAANKLAGKHQRIPLIRPPPSESARCDICQDKTGWFFCVEDRALLCRNCDVSIHSANALASGHKRFLVTGVRIGLKALSPQDFLEVPKVPESAQATNSSETSSPVKTPQNFEPRRTTSSQRDEQSNNTISEYLTESVPGWRLDELLNIPELAGGYTIADIGNSKADAGNLGEFDWLADISLFDEHLYVETSREVPEISPGLGKSSKPLSIKGKAKQSVTPAVPEFDELLLVPDLSAPQAKRRRTSFDI